MCKNGHIGKKIAQIADWKYYVQAITRGLLARTTTNFDPMIAHIKLLSSDR